MEFLYINEHANCFNYDNKSNPIIEIKEYSLDEKINISANQNKIIFINKGKILFSYGNIQKKEVSAGEIILFPMGYNYKIIAKEDTQLTIFRLITTISLCDRYSLENLLKDEDINSISEQIPLKLNTATENYIQTLHFFYNDGLKCIHFFEIKLKELFFILRAYYTKKELLAFFYPLVTADTAFSDFIVKNFHKAKNIKELAEISHYSLSGFEKKFKKVFGESPNQWLEDKKAKKIFHDLNNGNKSLKEISDEYNFSSTSYLNEFCKRKFNLTPGEIKKHQFNFNTSFNSF